jgi:hypothetical protein
MPITRLLAVAAQLDTAIMFSVILFFVLEYTVLPGGHHVTLFFFHLDAQQAFGDLCQVEFESLQRRAHPGGRW